MLIHVDRNGNPIELPEWLGLQATKEYVVVAFEKINGVEVSTVWTGIGNDRTERPLVFETMTFVDHEPENKWHQRCWRYATEGEALAGHETICSQLRTGLEFVVKEEE